MSAAPGGRDARSESPAPSSTASTFPASSPDRSTARREAYARIRAELSTIEPSADPRGERAERMERFVSAAWPALAPTGVSWIGFYEEDPEAPDSERLVLAAREPKPACSPIGVHGACGRCLRSGQPLVVRNVRELGANYVACDPRDMSEVVIPCLDARSRAWGVLDLDSHETGAFDESDASALEALLRLAGLTD